MIPLVIYHSNCAGGFGAAFAAWTMLGDEAEYRPAQYNVKAFEDEEVVKGRDVYILDFSFDKNVMLWIFETAKHVVWLDHHKTAFEMWGIEPNPPGTKSKIGNSYGADIILDNNKSGALLAWEYFHPGEEVPMLIQHIDEIIIKEEPK